MQRELNRCNIPKNAQNVYPLFSIRRTNVDGLSDGHNPELIRRDAERNPYHSPTERNVGSLELTNKSHRDPPTTPPPEQHDNLRYFRVFPYLYILCRPIVLGQAVTLSATLKERTGLNRSRCKGLGFSAHR